MKDEEERRQRSKVIGKEKASVSYSDISHDCMFIYFFVFLFLKKLIIWDK